MQAYQYTDETPDERVCEQSTYLVCRCTAVLVVLILCDREFEMNDAIIPTPDISCAEDILQKYGITTGAGGATGSRTDELLIPLLQDIQDGYGYLPREVLAWVSHQTGIPLARMYGVITFYTQFYLEPKGRHTIRCCEGTACHVKGGKRIAESIVDELGVQEGETTKDMKFTFETVQCLGTCFLAPVVMVDGDYYGEMTKEKLVKTLKRYE